MTWRNILCALKSMIKEKKEQELRHECTVILLSVFISFSFHFMFMNCSITINISHHPSVLYNLFVFYYCCQRRPLPNEERFAFKTELKTIAFLFNLLRQQANILQTNVCGRHMDMRIVIIYIYMKTIKMEFFINKCDIMLTFSFS